MANERITTESVALNVLETAPIVLRESETRRLVFKPMIVDQPEAPVRGYFVWQRKRKADEWEDITGESLTALKAGDEVRERLQGIRDVLTASDADEGAGSHKAIPEGFSEDAETPGWDEPED